MKLKKIITCAMFAGALITTTGCLGIDEDEAKEAAGLSPDEIADVEAAIAELDPEDKLNAENFSNDCKVLLGGISKAEKITEENRNMEIEKAQGKLVKECHKEIPDDFKFPEKHNSGEGHQEENIKISDKCEALAHGAPEVFMEECFEDVVTNNKPGSLDENCSSLYQGVWDEISKLVTEECVEEDDSESSECEELSTAATGKAKAFYDDCRSQVGKSPIFPDDIYVSGPNHHDDVPNLSAECQELRKVAEASNSEADHNAFVKDCPVMDHNDDPKAEL